MRMTAGWIPLSGRPKEDLERESEIVEIAMGSPADRGDPALIQQTRCTRAEANRVAGATIVPGEEQSYLIAIRGRFKCLAGRDRVRSAFPLEHSPPSIALG
jgi:hypothetical protein